MLIQSIFILAAAVAFVGVAWLARRSTLDGPGYRLFLTGWGLILLAYMGYTLLSYGLLHNIAVTDPDSAAALQLEGSLTPRGIAATGFALITTLYLWAVVASPRMRSLLSRIFPAPRDPQDTAPTPPDWRAYLRGFDPAQPVHAYALGLVQLSFFQTVIDTILAGGQSGLAAQGLTPADIVLSSILTAVMLISVALAGVGIRQARHWRAALARLGLRKPSITEILTGIGIAFGLIVFQYCAGSIWLLLTPPDVFDQQTELSQLIAGSVPTIGIAFLVAALSSIGEEIAFRGALQPVLGLLPTTVLFAMTHIQYQLSPAILIILVVGLTFGLLRRYYSTTVSIIAHFTYNFALLSLAVVAARILESV